MVVGSTLHPQHISRHVQQSVRNTRKEGKQDSRPYQKIIDVAPRSSLWLGGVVKMLAYVYSGDVPMSPKMMPIAL